MKVRKINYYFCLVIFELQKWLIVLLFSTNQGVFLLLIFYRMLFILVYLSSLLFSLLNYQLLPLAF
jgi:hypothetical protein